MQYVVLAMAMNVMVKLENVFGINNWLMAQAFGSGQIIEGAIRFKLST